MSDRPNESPLRRLAREVRSAPILARLRVRLIALVFVAVLPALGLIIYTAIEQRHLGVDAAKTEALRLVRLTSTTHERLIEGARQLLITLSQLDQVKSQDTAACNTLFSNLVRL